MARLILSGIEEIIYQRMGTIQATNSQFSFFSQFLPVWRFPAQAGSTCPGQEHRTGAACQRGCTGTGLKSLASCCICQWLNTGSWTRHSPGYFKPALSLCAFERGIMRTNVPGVFQWWTPVHDVWLSTNSHQLTTSRCCHSRCLCFPSFRQKSCASWLIMLIFNN